jgi:hypothetical protein
MLVFKQFFTFLKVCCSNASNVSKAVQRDLYGLFHVLFQDGLKADFVGNSWAF